MSFPVFFIHDDSDDCFELILLVGRQVFVVPHVTFKNHFPCRRPRFLKDSPSSSVSEPVEHYNLLPARRCVSEVVGMNLVAAIRNAVGSPHVTDSFAGIRRKMAADSFQFVGDDSY